MPWDSQYAGLIARIREYVGGARGGAPHDEPSLPVRH